MYRPIGTVEAALIAEADWKAFPAMPDNFPFYAYTQPVSDPREWQAQVNDIEFFECLEDGQDLVVRSWQAWGNATDEYYVVWFEVDERIWNDNPTRLNVNAVNDALVGKIAICARYGPSGVWIDPKLAAHLPE